MSNVLLGFVGDVFVDRENPHEVFRHVRDILGVPDVMFANLESTYTDDPVAVPSGLYTMHGPAHNLDVFSEVGFDVMSLANNHILDAGYDAMLQTAARLKAQGVRTCGVGDCIEDARRPAVIETNGLRLAYLAYASVFPMGYEARGDRPGLVPMRAHNFYRDPFPILLEPGRFASVSTIPDEKDLAHLTNDLKKARLQADVVIASFHWGDSLRPFRLTDHERRIARHCIDQGADMVVGHHHHALRGMEWYKGKPIMYGLSHFVFDLKTPWKTLDEYKAWLAQVDPEDWIINAPYQMGPREGWPYLPMHEDTRMTLFAWARADRTGITDIGFLPCTLTPDGSVLPLKLDSPEGEKVVRYFNQCNTTQDLNSEIDASDAMTIAGFQTLRVRSKA